MAKFDEYLYNPADPKVTAKVIKDIPEFKFKCPDIDGLIRYTIYTYDPHADLLRLFPTDFNRRKREAAIKAGFKIHEGHFEQWVEDYIVGDNEDYNAAIVAFVIRFNVADLPAYVMYREVFFGEFLAAMNARDSKEKKEIMANAEIARIRMAELEKKLFTGDEVVNIRSQLYVLAEKMKLNLRPEEKAREIDSKQLIVNDPYFGKE